MPMGRGEGTWFATFIARIGRPIRALASLADVCASAIKSLNRVDVMTSSFDRRQRDYSSSGRLETRRNVNNANTDKAEEQEGPGEGRGEEG